MKLSDEMKRQALQAWEGAHHAKAKRLFERMRICGWSFKDVAECWRRALATRFLSIVDSAPFCAEAAEFFVENADAIIAELAGVEPDRIYVVQVSPFDGGLFVWVSLGVGPDAPTLRVIVDGDGGAKLVPLGSDWTGKSGTDGKLHVRRQAPVPERDAS